MLDLQKDIKEPIEALLELSEFSVHSKLKIDDVDYKMAGDYYILHFSGGLNGRGQFLFYMEDVSEIVKMLLIRFNHCWLIKWENDCPDDLFTLDIGVRF